MDYWRDMMGESSVANSWEISDQFGGKIWQLMKTFRLIEIFTFFKDICVKKPSFLCQDQEEKYLFIRLTQKLREYDEENEFPRNSASFSKKLPETWPQICPAPPLFSLPLFNYATEQLTSWQCWEKDDKIGMKGDFIM